MSWCGGDGGYKGQMTGVVMVVAGKVAWGLLRWFCFYCVVVVVKGKDDELRRKFLLLWMVAVVVA